MYRLVSRQDFHDAFRKMDRADEFSHNALDAIFDYYEEREEDEVGTQLDVIGICCEWNEYNSMELACEAYDCETGDDLNDEYGVIVVNDNCVLVMSM